MKMYFKIELRMSEYFEEYYEEDFIKSEQFYVGDGILSIDNGKIEGYVALNYIHGEYDGNVLYLNVNNFSDSEVICLEANIEEADFTFPNAFALDIKDNDGQVALLTIFEKVTSDISHYENRIETIKELSEIF